MDLAERDGGRMHVQHAKDDCLRSPRLTLHVARLVVLLTDAVVFFCIADFVQGRDGVSCGHNLLNVTPKIE